MMRSHKLLCHLFQFLQGNLGSPLHTQMTSCLPETEIIFSDPRANYTQEEVLEI